MTVYKSARLVGSVVFLSMTIAAHAAEPRIPSWYTSIESGDVSPASDDFEDSEVASIFFGRQYSEKYGFELGYVDLGSYEYLERTEDDDEVKGLQLSMYRTFPVRDPFTLHFELGFLIEGAGVNPFHAIGIGGPGYVDSTFLFGFGAMLDLSETVGGRVTFRRYNDTSAKRVDTVSYGIYLRF